MIKTKKQTKKHIPMHECVQFIHQLFIPFSVMLLISVRLFFIFQSFLEALLSVA